MPQWLYACGRPTRQRRLTVEGRLRGRGREFAVAEMTAPVRTLTTSSPIAGGVRPMAPPGSCGPLPKASLWEALQRLDGQRVALGGAWFAAAASVPAAEPGKNGA